MVLLNYVVSEKISSIPNSYLETFWTAPFTALISNFLL